MSNKKRRRDRRGQSPAKGGRVTAPKNKARGLILPTNEVSMTLPTNEAGDLVVPGKGSTFTSEEGQAIVVGKDGITHKITNRAGTKGEAAVAEALAMAEGKEIRYGRASNMDEVFEVFNIPEADRILREWKRTGALPSKPDGTPKRVALRCEGGEQAMEPRIPELVAGLRLDGNDHIADFIEAGHWFDAGDMTGEELAAQGYGIAGGAPLEGIHAGSNLRQFQSGYALMSHGEDEKDVKWTRVPDIDNNEFDPAWPHRHFSDYTHVPDGGLSDYDTIDDDWRSKPAPEIFKHRIGYHADAPRDLGIPVDADGDHMLSHGDGCALAHTIHKDALDFFQSSFGQLMCQSFFKSQEDPQANLIFPFPPDTTIDTAPAYMAKRLAGAQVMWVDQMMAEVIDAGADLLWQEGVEHDSWPINTAEDMEVFNNVFIVSVQKDEHGTWPNVKWGTIGHTTGASPREDWLNYEPGHPMFFHKKRGLYWIQMTDWMLPCNETILEYDTSRQALTSETMDLLMSVMISLRERGEAKPEHMNLPGWVASSGCLAVSVAARSFYDYITRRPLQEIHVPRSMRRNAERKHGTIRPTIKIVTLPRAPHRPGKHNKTDRKLTCQFWVDEHRRYQHYPSLGPAYHDNGEWNRDSHKPILIPGYVKGPEDRPWKATKGTVYRLAKKQEQRGTL